MSLRENGKFCRAADQMTFYLIDKKKNQVTKKTQRRSIQKIRGSMFLGELWTRFIEKKQIAWAL